MKNALAFVVLALLAACASAPPPEVFKPTPRGQRELAVIMSFMSGTYDSIGQEGPGVKGPGPGTRMRIAPFWKEREKQGEYWLYVEHTQVANDTKPFRQRIYRFTESEGAFTGAVYALPGSPERFAGEWRKPSPFAEYQPAQLREYEGCRLKVGQMTMIFWARTEGKTCSAELGAYQEYTEMLVASNGMKDGEQAYDASGKLVAGEAGVWDFRRTSREPK
jgi:hypothetical protein